MCLAKGLEGDGEGIRGEGGDSKLFRRDMMAPEGGEGGSSGGGRRG